MYPQGAVDRALRLSDIGVTDKEIAQIFGVSVAVIQRWRVGRRRAASGIGESGRLPAHAAIRGLGTSRHTHTCWASIWATGTSSAGERMCMHSRSPALTVGQVSWTRPSRRCRLSCPRRECAVSGRPGARWSRVTRSTGRACSPSTGRGLNTTGKSNWKAGRKSSCSNIPGEFAKGLFHSDGWRGVNRVRHVLSDGEHWYEYPRYLFGNESADILRLCGEALDRLGVAWRFSRRNVISVARREAVARLDQFAGPKY